MTAAFFGADHKCGTSQLALCIAERLAGICPSLKVLLIHAEEPLGVDYSPDIRESMGRIRPYLAESLYDMDDIVLRSLYKENLYIIGGAGSPASAGQYPVDSVLPFFCKVSTVFDIVIFDSGADISHGLSVSSLVCADEIFYVFSQNETALRHYEWQRSIIGGLKKTDENIIINKYSNDSSYEVNYIRERLDRAFKTVSLVPLHPDGDEAELKGLSLEHYRCRAFRKSIEALAVRLAGAYGAV